VSDSVGVVVTDRVSVAEAVTLAVGGVPVVVWVGVPVGGVPVTLWVGVLVGGVPVTVWVGVPVTGVPVIVGVPDGNTVSEGVAVIEPLTEVAVGVVGPGTTLAKPGKPQRTLLDPMKTPWAFMGSTTPQTIPPRLWRLAVVSVTMATPSVPRDQTR
jgi:hypothetical protein